MLSLLSHSHVIFVAGFSVLHLAIVKLQNECAKLIITELGAKAVNALNESGVTAVHIAASAGMSIVMQMSKCSFSGPDPAIIQAMFKCCSFFIPSTRDFLIKRIVKV